MLPVRLTVPLEHGSVTLQAWGANVADAYLLDLMNVTTTLAALREHWQDFRASDLEQHVWPAFWRLVQASLECCQLPQEITWNDRLELLNAMWELNRVEEAEGKLMALEATVQAYLLELSRKLQGQMTTPPTNT